MLPEAPLRSLHLYLPRLPEFEMGNFSLPDAWIEDFFWLNTGIRLVELKAGGQTERDLLESCSISKEDGSYRLQIRKGRRFSQGDEVTASDVIASLLRTARRPSSGSQLGQLLRYKGGDCARSFKLHSRYRFEIFLEGLVPDLLERLALPECSIHRAGAGSSGSWYVAQRDADSLTLKPNPLRSGNSELIYEQVIVSTLEQAPLSGSAKSDEHAFVAIFPRSRFKAPQTNILSGAMSLALRPELQLALWLRDRGTGLEPLRSALTAFAKQRNVWGLERLAQLYPEQSFGVEANLHESPWVGSIEERCWTLSYDPSLVSAAFLEDLSAYVAHHHRLQLSFTSGPEGADGALLITPNYSREGSLRTAELGIRLFLRHGVGGSEVKPTLERLLHDTDEAHRDRLFREYLHKLVHHPQFLPLGRVPLIAYSNRSLPENQPLLGSLRLSEIGESRPRREAKELREATVSALGSAVEMLAHDIRRPFGTLEGILSLLASTEDPQRIRDLARQYLPHVRRITHTVNEMITDILEMGASSDTLSEPLSPLTAFEESLRLLLPSKKRLDLACEWRHKLQVAGDIYKLTRIFSNILNNAMQATPDGGSIRVSTREHEAAGKVWMDITIHNSGSYISPEKRQRIFEAFYTEGKEQGTGLGLAIVKKFVLAHHGHISCDSDRETGTRFTVTLPSSYRLDPAPQEVQLRIEELWKSLGPSEEPQPLPEVRWPTLRFLWIDDDPLDLIYGRELLQSLEDEGFGVELETCSDPEAALKLVERTGFDLILIDYQLGASDGLLWIPRFRRLLPEARIALHSHRSSGAIHAAALQVGADFFFPKPLQKLALLSFCQSARKSKSKSKSKGGEGSLVLIEDDPLFVEIWQTHCSLGILHFDSPEAFQKASLDSPELLKECRALISDGVFAEGGMTGQTLLAEIALREPGLQLFLCTHLPEAQESLPRPWKRISKDPAAIITFLENL